MFETSARASPWQIGLIEWHGGIWKDCFRKLIWTEQLSRHEEIQRAVSSKKPAKNPLTRKSGFSPTLWSLGRDIRLPASLADDTEATRTGAQAAADTPGAKFYRKQQLGMAAREDLADPPMMQPSRHPFKVRSSVFYYDAQDRLPVPNFCRGIDRESVMKGIARFGALAGEFFWQFRLNSSVLHRSKKLSNG